MIYEKDEWIGGYVNIVDIEFNGWFVVVDIGFIVYNECNYLNLIVFFEYIDVLIVDSCMLFLVFLDGGKLEYGIFSVYGFFG